MNIERLFKVVLIDLTSTQLKLESEMESVINSTDELELKSIKIRKLLSDIVMVESSITKFSNMVSQLNNNEQKKGNDE